MVADTALVTPNVDFLIHAAELRLSSIRLVFILIRQRLHVPQEKQHRTPGLQLF